MFTAKVGNKTFQINKNLDQSMSLNDQEINWDLVKTGKTGFHILKDNQSYLVDIVSINKEDKTTNIRVNGTDYQISMKDKMDLLLESMGMSSMATKKIKNFQAQMPGLILDLKVEIGQEVKEGDPLLVLEAMKMENVLKSPADLTIKNILVNQGDAVEKKQVLIEFA
ncbi:MAG: biotin/lipoyl-binding protein [Flavobacteriales bacterium]|jgi:acetyl/propionyl-CoA carboxylase alpha subunit|nr:biotin/lipoyl-binding protein [Flavobacteriales bacterium]